MIGSRTIGIRKLLRFSLSERFMSDMIFTLTILFQTHTIKKIGTRGKYLKIVTGVLLS